MLKGLQECPRGSFSITEQQNLFHEYEWRNVWQDAMATCTMCLGGPWHWGHPKKNKKPSNQDQVRWLVQMSVQKTVPTLPFPRQWDYYKLCPNLPFPSLNQFQCSQEQQLYDYWHGFYFKITTKTMKNDIGGKTEILFADKVLEYICLHIGEIVKIIHNFLFLTE